MSDFTMDPHPVPRRQGRQEDQLSRRDVVKAALGVVGLGSLGIGAFVGRVALWPHRLVYQFPEMPGEPVTLTPTPACGDHAETDSYEEGPFYAPNTPPKTDLRRIGHRGRDLILRGRVLDTQCRPIPNAVLDLSQVDENRVYAKINSDSPGARFPKGAGTVQVETN